jgi:osmotically-inducible protein OsmY
MIALPAQIENSAAQDLQERVALFLAQRHLTFGARLRIEANRGVVTLTGQVPTFHQRQLIYAFTRRVAGVVLVVDRLEVESSALPDSRRRPWPRIGTVLS